MPDVRILADHLPGKAQLATSTTQTEEETVAHEQTGHGHNESKQWPTCNRCWAVVFRMINGSTLNDARYAEAKYRHTLAS